MQEVARQAIREYVENHSRAELLDTDPSIACVAGLDSC
jgi:hypothetical protein